MSILHERPQTPSNAETGAESLFTAPDVLYLSPEDERANTLTHGVGALASLGVGIYFYFRNAGIDAGLQLACQATAMSMTLVYIFSTLSHAVHAPKQRQMMRAWDQGTIYLLIAGTYSPFIWLGSPEGYRSVLLFAVWLAAMIGFYSKVGGGHRINSISTVTYVLLGWLPAIPLWPRTPLVCFAWMMIGGLCYTCGIFFLKKSEKIRYSHAVWHIAVMLGSAAHVYAIILLLS